jgi:hypothetical protein
MTPIHGASSPPDTAAGSDRIIPTRYSAATNAAAVVNHFIWSRWMPRERRNRMTRATAASAIEIGTSRSATGNTPSSTGSSAGTANGFSTRG